MPPVLLCCACDSSVCPSLLPVPASPHGAPLPSADGLCSRVRPRAGAPQRTCQAAAQDSSRYRQRTDGKDSARAHGPWGHPFWTFGCSGNDLHLSLSMDLKALLVQCGDPKCGAWGTWESPTHVSVTPECQAAHRTRGAASLECLASRPYGAHVSLPWPAGPFYVGAR